MQGYTTPLFPDLIVVKGTGAMADGVALRLFHSGYHVILVAPDYGENHSVTGLLYHEVTHLADAALDGTAEVEDITARLVPWPPVPDLLKTIMAEGEIPVVYPGCNCDTWMDELQPAGLVDATMTGKEKSVKRRPGIVTIGLGPGFIAGPAPDELIGVDAQSSVDFMVDVVVETALGPKLGTVILEGEALICSGKHTGGEADVCPSHARAVGGGVLEALLMFGIMPAI